MIIGVDCDGVLTDMSEYIFEYGEKWFKRKPDNLNGCGTSEIFYCTEKEEFMFGLKYFFTYCKKWPPRDNASEIIRKLNNDGHTLYEITARKFVTQRSLLGWYSRYLFEHWLKKFNFNFESIFYCSESTAPKDKLSGCNKYNVDLMVDDNPDVAHYLANKGIKVLLFDTRYNQNLYHDNIIRVYDWNDIYEKISKLEI